jgi:hypothetical protein
MFTDDKLFETLLTGLVATRALFLLGSRTGPGAPFVEMKLGVLVVVVREETTLDDPGGPPIVDDTRGA